MLLTIGRGPPGSATSVIMAVLAGILILFMTVIALWWLYDLVIEMLGGPRAKPPPHRVCRGCGYDLRASKLRCPECGEPIPPPPLPRFVVYRGHALRRRSDVEEFDQEPM